MFRKHEGHNNYHIANYGQSPLTEEQIHAIKETSHQRPDDVWHIHEYPLQLDPSKRVGEQIRFNVSYPLLATDKSDNRLVLAVLPEDSFASALIMGRLVPRYDDLVIVKLDPASSEVLETATANGSFYPFNY